MLIMLFLLGILDILGGIFMFFPGSIAFFLGVLILLKGVSSMFGMLTGNLGIIIMGIIDLVTGVALVFGFFVPWLWLLVIIKGAYSLVAGLS